MAADDTTSLNANIGAANIPYFTPAQAIPAGTALNPQPSGQPIPKLFRPLKIRGIEFQNRIFLSALGQNSADNGKFTPWHLAHLGGITIRGPGLSITEGTAVLPEGRTSPEDAGIWSDEHIEPLAQIVQLAHSQNQKIGIQLAHAGRKASGMAPWIKGDAVTSEALGGWPNNVWGPSVIPYHESYAKPKALARAGIRRIVEAFRDAAVRSVEAGVDVIEIQAAHGYLIHEFLSPISNKRTDEYGGAFENRVRFALEVAEAVRSAIPGDMPLFFRVSATDWLEEALPDEPSWRSEETVKLAPLLFERGVDLIDVSTGGLHPAQRIKFGQAYQAPFALDIIHSFDRDTSRTSRPRGLVGTVGGVTNGHTAEDLLQKGIDVVFIGRQFLRDPATVCTFAEDLNVDIQLAHQIGWPFRGRARKIVKG